MGKDKIVLTNQLLEIDANARGMGPANGVQLIGSSSTTNTEFTKWPQGSNVNKIWPYELILFAEGTFHQIVLLRNLLNSLRREDYHLLKHVLLPRIRGLFLALKKLKSSVEIVYDITTAYSGLTEDQYGEIEYSLKRFYLKGYGPPKINYYIKGWKLKDIPLGEDVDDIDNILEQDLKKFEDWLLKIWYEKDKLMDNHYKLGNWGELNHKTTRSIIGDFKLRNQFEIFLPFLATIATILFLRIAYILIRRIINV